MKLFWTVTWLRNSEGYLQYDAHIADFREIRMTQTHHEEVFSCVQWLFRDNLTVTFVLKVTKSHGVLSAP